MIPEPSKVTWRDKLHEIIYEADTPIGKFFDLALLFIILLSIALVMLESVHSLNVKYFEIFYLAEWVITFIFSVEYILRILSIRKPWTYIFSFYGIVDLLSTIPTYLVLIFGGHNFFFAIRALRLLRIFRILKTTHYIGESNKLWRAVKNSRVKVFVFLFTVLIICVIMGTVMFMIEGPENGFTNIPVSVYWCIVTLTTVGFGDIHPITPAGQAIASLIMIVGYGIIAVPTGIVSAEYTRSVKNRPVLNTQVCRFCNEAKHLDGAEYCHNCGNKLNV